MHSLKNTMVAVTLLAISFGLYQVSLTPETNIDPSQTPLLDIKDGIGEFANKGIDAVKSKISSFGSDTTFGSETAAPKLNAPNLSAPSLSAQNLNAPNNRQLQGMPRLGNDSSSFGRQPLVSTDNNNVQTIKYPAPNQANAPNRMPPTNQFASIPKAPEISQRKLVDDSANEGLIEALKNQRDFEAAMDSMVDTNTADAGKTLDAAKSMAASVGQNIEQNVKQNFNQLKENAGEFVAAANDFAKQELKIDNSFANKAKQAFASEVEKVSTAAGNAVEQVKSAATAATNDMAATSGTAFSAQPIANNDSTFNQLASNFSAPDSQRNVQGNVALADKEPNIEDLTFNAAWPKVDQLVKAGQFRTALKLLSRFYNDTDLTGPQRQRLLGWLDALAGKVIFSEENHLSSSPYTIQSNESLVDVARKWNVTPQLIANVNQTAMKNSQGRPGTSLKTIPGPFRAEIDLQRNQMTLFLNDLYAGRFPVRVGISGETKPGSYKILLKSQEGHTWRDANGNDYPPNAPQNGYGPNWIGLSGSLCIHCVPASATEGHRGCIGLSAKDSKDVFAILSDKSDIRIIR